MNDSNSTPHSVELGSDSDTWPSSEQDEVVHNPPKDVKEHFGMLVFAKFAGHPPHPAVVWDPRFSLPRVSKQWYQSKNMDKEYIVKWLGYDEECSMWNKVPERSIEETKLGSNFDEHCKKTPHDSIYQKGCNEMRKALEEGITNNQRWREQRKHIYQIEPMKTKGTPGRKKKDGTPSRVPSSCVGGVENRKRQHKSDGSSSLNNNVTGSDEKEMSSSKSKIRRSGKRNKLIQKAVTSTTEPNQEEQEIEDDELAAAVVILQHSPPGSDGNKNDETELKKSSNRNTKHSKFTRRGTSSSLSSRSINNKEEEMMTSTMTAEPKRMKKQISNNKSSRRSLRRSAAAGTTTTFRSVESIEQQLEEDRNDTSKLSTAAATLKHKESMTKNVNHDDDVVLDMMPNDEGGEGEQELTTSEPVVVHDESQEQEDAKQKHKQSSLLMSPPTAAVAVAQTYSSPRDDAAEIKPVKKLLRRHSSNKGSELKHQLPPDQIDTTPLGRVAQCVERLKTAIDNGSIEAQLEALDKLEKEKFDFEVMKKTRAGKVVSKLVRKSRDIVVGTKAGALEKRWRGLLESKEDQDMLQQEGTTTILSLPTVSSKQQQQPPKLPAVSSSFSTAVVSPSPKSKNLLVVSSSTLKQNQRPPLAVAKPSPKLDAMALLEDVMPRVDLSLSQSSAESSGVHSYSRQVTVSHRHSTAESGLEVDQSSAAGVIQHLDFARKRGLSLLTMGLCKPYCNGPSHSPSMGEIQKAKDIESAIFTATNNMEDDMPQCGNAYKDRIRVVSMLLGNGEKSGRKLYSKVMSGLIVVDDLVTKTPLELLCWVN